MPKSATPLFDKLCETIEFVWSSTVPLFKPEFSQLDHEKTLSELDRFLAEFIALKPEVTGLVPAYERTYLYRIAKSGEGLPNPNLMRRELIQVVLACSMPEQMELLKGEVRKVFDQIDTITTLVLYDLPSFKAKWLTKLQNAIARFNDEVWSKEYMMRTGLREWDIAVLKDHHWPNAIKYLKCLTQLVERIFVYAIDLREFTSRTVQITEGEDIDSVGSKKKKDTKSERAANTQRKARQAITYYEGTIENLVKIEKGKQHPLSDNEIVKRAITKYTEAIGLNLAQTPKGLNRYLTDIGENQTALKYGRQLVQKYRSGKGL